MKQQKNNSKSNHFPGIVWLKLPYLETWASMSPLAESDMMTFGSAWLDCGYIVDITC